MQTRLSKSQIDELDDALKGVLRWSLLYGHLASLEKAAALGFRAVRDLRSLAKVEMPAEPSANLRQPEEPVA